MRTRKEIFDDIELANKREGTPNLWSYRYQESERNEAFQKLALEVLLDIRDLAQKIDDKQQDWS
jgi:hypothetical protein